MYFRIPWNLESVLSRDAIVGTFYSSLALQPTVTAIQIYMPSIRSLYIAFGVFTLFFRSILASQITFLGFPLILNTDNCPQPEYGGPRRCGSPISPELVKSALEDKIHSCPLYSQLNANEKAEVIQRVREAINSGDNKFLMTDQVYDALQNFRTCNWRTETQQDLDDAWDLQNFLREPANRQRISTVAVELDDAYYMACEPEVDWETDPTADIAPVSYLIDAELEALSQFINEASA